MPKFNELTALKTRALVELLADLEKRLKYYFFSTSITTSNKLYQFTKWYICTVVLGSALPKP